MTNKEIGISINTTAKEDGMPPTLCDLIEDQSRHETANYTSNAFLKNNNCFGYKYVHGAKWQISAGITSSEGDPYAKYQSIQDSVHELTDWIKRRQKGGNFPSDLSEITTPTQYATLLKKCGYFGDKLENYIAGLTHYSNIMS